MGDVRSMRPTDVVGHQTCDIGGEPRVAGTRRAYGDELGVETANRRTRELNRRKLGHSCAQRVASEDNPAARGALRVRRADARANAGRNGAVSVVEALMYANAARIAPRTNFRCCQVSCEVFECSFQVAKNSASE